MNWDDLRYFLAVVQGGGLTRAAQELKVSAATVSRRMDALEQILGQTLFIRRQTGYVLTREGQTLYDSCLPVEDAMLALQRRNLAASAAENLTGTIRVACGEMVALSCIAPHLQQFFMRYPELHVDMRIDTSTVNLSRQDADIAVRLVPPSPNEEGDFIAHTLGHISFATYRSTTHWPADTDWQQLPYISWPQELEHLPVAQSLNHSMPTFAPRLTSNCYNIHYHGARHGLGIALLPCIVGDADTQLVRIAHAPQLICQIWLVYHRDLRNSQRLIVMREFLLSVFAQMQAKQ